MSKVADVKLSWTKSATADIKKVSVVVSNNGTETTADFGPEVESFNIVVQASSSVNFKVVVTDSEGLTATSSVYSFTLSDLEAPQPATNLKHEVVGIRDVGPNPSQHEHKKEKK